MGRLSRKRTLPRVVKKSRGKAGRHVSISQVAPSVRKYWNQKKTLKQNMDSMGLAYKLSPNLRHSPEG